MHAAKLRHHPEFVAAVLMAEDLVIEGKPFSPLLEPMRRTQSLLPVVAAACHRSVPSGGRPIPPLAREFSYKGALRPRLRKENSRKYSAAGDPYL